MPTGLFPKNQDRLSDSVWITRADNRGIFNIALEFEYDRTNNLSPVGTEWAVGSITDGIENLEFVPWFRTNPDGPDDDVGIAKVMHLIADDIYLDITITQWTGGGGGSGTGFGGGFTYVRSTPDTSTALVNIAARQPIKIFPNPSTHFIALENIKETGVYRIMAMDGRTVSSGTYEAGDLIDVSRLEAGVYLLNTEGFGTARFVKQ